MDWDRSRTTVCGVVVGLGLGVAGAFAGGPDLAVLGAAPVVAGFWDWRRRPSSMPTVQVVASDAEVVPGRLQGDAVITTPAGAEAALVGVRRGRTDLCEVLVGVDGIRR